MSKLIVPQWPLPKGVAACSSSRIGGVSLPPYDSLNLGAHCGDNPDHVEENRKRLFAAGNLPSSGILHKRWDTTNKKQPTDRTSAPSRWLLLTFFDWFNGISA